MAAPTPMRLWWRASPRKLLASFAVLLLAIAGARLSGASFTATSPTPANVITAGILSQTNSASGQAILTASNIAPGSTTTGTVLIANSGDLPARVVLRQTTKLDMPPAAAFSAKLLLLIEDLGDPSCSSCDPTASTVWSGKLGALAEVNLGTYAPAARHRYRFSVTYPDGGPNGGDNAYGGASTQVGFAWEATQ